MLCACVRITIKLKYIKSIKHMEKKLKPKNLLKGLKNKCSYKILFTVSICLLMALTVSCRSESEHLVNYDEDGTTRLVISNLYPTIGEQITVNVANNSNAKGTVDFGDGTEAVAISKAAHTYEAEGTYVVTAKIEGVEKPITKLVKVSLLALTRALKQFDDPNYKEIWVMAHRANTENLSIPENSISSIKAAIAAGCDVIECDPRRTLDGHLVVCHDEDIRRTTTGTGNISNLTLDQIKSYPLKDRNGNVTNETMPTLKEFLEAARGKVYVDLDYSPRTASAAEVYNIVKECGMLEQVFFYNNTNEKNLEVLSLDPALHAYCWGTPNTYAGLLNKGRHFFLQYNYNSDVRMMSKAREAGFLLSTIIMDFGGENGDIERHLQQGEDTEIKSMINNSVRMIMTDTPETLVGYLRANGYHK